MQHQIPIWILMLVTVAGAHAERYVQKHPLSNQLMAVVAEGEFEPRSIGSYSVRIYRILDPDLPTDNYVCGTIAERDGTIEQVIVRDLDNDGQKEVIVCMRCVGTGSYLSADAYCYANRSLKLVSSFRDLPRDTDPIAALKRRIKKE